MSAKEKILKKLDIRYWRYSGKYGDAKTERSEVLWTDRKEASYILSSLAGYLLDDEYSLKKCERIMRQLTNSVEISGTPHAKAILYVIDDIL